MNFKDFFLSAVMAFVTVWLMQYLFIKPTRDNGTASFHAGQMVEIPASEVLLKPLNTEVRFIKTETPSAPIKTDVETSYGIFTFANEGASIERFAVRRIAYGKETMFPLIAPAEPLRKERAAFLVALQENTPYSYEFMGKHSENNTTLMTYRAVHDMATITKVFKVYHDRYQVDLTITLEPKKDEILQPRVIFPGPLLNDPQLSNDEKAIVFTDQQKVDKKLEADITHNFWVAPALVGIENRYFVIAHVHDKEHFVQRAYFKVDDRRMVAFLEGPVVKEITSWTVSFFMGPKEVHALETVDKRLLETLDYGFFAWLGRIMMAILNWLYSYLHNYGWAIIALTILMRLAMAPLSFKGQSYMRKTSEIQKKQQYIEHQYKNDPEMLMQKRQEIVAQAALPMIAGCAVTILQIPVFFGLSSVLRSSIELYQAPFMLWIKDLSAADPYYVLPILFGTGLVILSSSTGTFDPRQRLSSLMIAFVVVALMANLSAGVLLFTTTSIWMGIAENRLYKMMKKKS